MWLVLSTFSYESSFLLPIEYYQWVSAGSTKNYLEDFRNQLDLSSIMCHMFYACMVLMEDANDRIYTPYSNFLLTISMVIGVLRGFISALRAHRSTRFISQMMLLITLDILPFLVVYVCGIMYFGVIFTQLEKFGEDFNEDYTTLVGPFRVFFTIWNLAMGYMDYRFKTHLGISIYFIATVVQNIVSLNMLISVIGDSYEKYMGHASRIELKLKASQMIEAAMIKIALPYLSSRDEDNFMGGHIYAFRPLDKQIDDEWAGKFKEVIKKVNIETKA